MSKKKLLIGIPGFTNSDKMFGVTGNYMQFASKFGNVRILMPHEDVVDLDLLILPGGMDLSPSSYGQVPGYQTGNHDVFKEYFFKNKLAKYIEAKTPIFGICLGFQMLNVQLGGKLTQHLLFHPTSTSRWTKAHDIVLTEDDGKTFTKEKPRRTFDVNSHHHQAVVVEDLAEGLDCIAYHNGYNQEGVVVEAFRHRELKIAGVQYHPEEYYDPISEFLINELLKKD